MTFDEYSDLEDLLFTKYGEFEQEIKMVLRHWVSGKPMKDCPIVGDDFEDCRAMIYDEGPDVGRQYRGKPMIVVDLPLNSSPR